MAADDPKAAQAGQAVQAVPNPIKDQAKATRKDATKKLKSVKVRAVEVVAAETAYVKENAEHVETLQFAVGDVQSLNQAIRNEEIRLMKAQKSVMNMFVTKTLCTCGAWLTQELLTKLLTTILYGDESTTLLISMIYASFIGVSVPIAQGLLARTAPAAGRNRMTSMVLLQKKALPMTIMWANKSAVADFISQYDSTLLPSVIVSVVMTLVVTGMLHLPPVVRAQAARRKGEHGICLRYLCWPTSFLLALGYAYNSVSTWFVGALTDQFSSLSQGAQYIVMTILQSVYFSIMALTVTRLDAYWTNRRLRVVEKKMEGGDASEDKEEHLDLSDIAHSIERELETDIGDTMQKAVAFVYAWGLSNTFNAMYYNFFLNLGSYSDGTYQQGWYFAMGLSIILIYGTRQLSVTRYRSPASQSYKKLMINAMACTLGWAYMNVMALTTSYFATELTASWGSNNGWNDALCYVIMFFIVQAVCAEIFFQIQDEFVVHQRMITDFHEAYPTELPEEFEDLDGDGQLDRVPPAAREAEV